MDQYADDTTVEYIFDLVDTTLDDVNAWTVKNAGPDHYWVKPYPVLGTGRHGHASICIALHAWKAGEIETPTPAAAIRDQAYILPMVDLGDPGPARRTVYRPKHHPSWRASDITQSGAVPFGDYFLNGAPIYGYIHLQQVGERRFGLSFDWTSERVRNPPFSEIAERLLPGVLNKAYPPRGLCRVWRPVCAFSDTPY